MTFTTFFTITIVILVLYYVVVVLFDVNQSGRRKGEKSYNESVIKGYSFEDEQTFHSLDDEVVSTSSSINNRVDVNPKDTDYTDNSFVYDQQDILDNNVDSEVVNYNDLVTSFDASVLQYSVSSFNQIRDIFN